MKGRTVVAPDGRAWTIRRHWVGRPPRFRWLLHPRKLKGAVDWIDLPVGDAPGWVWIPVAIVGLAILVFFVIPALIFVVELVLFLVLASLVLLVNSLFRRAWVVEASEEGPDRRSMRWRVVGLFRSRRVMGEVAEGLAQGHRRIEIPEAERADGQP